jgi:hypothetical protein
LILFSEKSIQWPESDTNVAWCRWARKAIQSSAKQLRGAERWLREFPDRVYLDAACLQKLPIEIPAAGLGNVHRIVVARGAEGACRRYYGTGSGTLLIKPSVRGDMHWNQQAPGFQPFCVGEIEPSDTVIVALRKIERSGR